MFGYNITTLIIILVIALLLFGPKRLPELGDSIGKAIRGFKKAVEPESIENQPAGNPPPGGPALRTCPECQKNVGGEFSFCPHCGHKLPPDAASTANPA